MSQHFQNGKYFSDTENSLPYLQTKLQWKILQTFTEARGFTGVDDSSEKITLERIPNLIESTGFF